MWAMAMKPVEHPFRGGNHQHIGKPFTIHRDAPVGHKVGLIAACQNRGPWETKIVQEKENEVKGLNKVYLSATKQNQKQKQTTTTTKPTYQKATVIKMVWY